MVEDKQKKGGRSNAWPGGTRQSRQERSESEKRSGWLAERRVAYLLNRLPRDSFHVANGVRFCWGDIDHLVTRRDGVVFLIETKSHKGTVGWDGRRLLLDDRPLRENWIGQVMRGVRWLRRLVRLFWGEGPWIVGVIVLANGKVDFSREVKGVYVVEGCELLRLLEANQQVP